MSETREDGGPAFPLPGWQDIAWPQGTAPDFGTGLSVRDYFAAQLSANLFNGREYTVGKCGFNPPVYEAVAREAYRFADAMLRARKGTP